MNTPLDSASFLEKYTKIKIVGKGSSGTAILYERNIDKKLVVVKEVNLFDLSENEKELALNEVHVLSVLNHPNIIGYYGSLEQNGSLFIEMEYADNGTLADLLNTLNSTNNFLPNTIIVHVFSQIVSAICHIHANNILHRDLKTANIFLNIDGSVKVGDFGLSKLLTTRIWTDTVLGTPFYLSPEMCAGEEYNEKSDVWALGCILYEMITLKKPFQATNLTALVKKITEEDIIPLPHNVNCFQELVTSLLQKQPNLRPTAEIIKTNYLPEISKEISKTKCFEEFSGERLQPINLPPKRFSELSISDTHYIALTSGDILNHNSTNLKIIETLKNSRIQSINCGHSHAVALSEDGTVYCWGKNIHGCLGLGEPLKNKADPTKIDLPLMNNQIINIFIGSNATGILDSNGVLYLCGSNIYQKLTPRKVEFLSKFSQVQYVKSKIKMVSLGEYHTAILTVKGQVFTLGNNDVGQLDKITPCRNRIVQVYSHDQILIQYDWMKKGNSCVGLSTNPDITCGPCYTAAITNNNVLYLWGKQFSFSLNPISPTNSLLNTAINSLKPTKTDDETLKFFNEMASIHLTNLIFIPTPILAYVSQLAICCTESRSKRE
ncbi:serine/threonine-protein kinase Nek8 [Chrysoperla carnea]|uniref:serine/threonine-protein kinase Nek8 n=1 Tax=Chrysoperla carnea TaxID=189513 RepID=UPI001D078C90|nr:serine/threonine-protein kinase Nek8 [Chrysoperla carnea]